MTILDEIKQRVKKAATQWGPYNANLPFYGIVLKPRPSMSKHDSQRPEYWHIDDAIFIANARKDMLFLIRHVELLEDNITADERVKVRLEETDKYLSDTHDVLTMYREKYKRVVILLKAFAHSVDESLLLDEELYKDWDKLRQEVIDVQEILKELGENNI